MKVVERLISTAAKLFKRLAIFGGTREPLSNDPRSAQRLSLEALLSKVDGAPRSDDARADAGHDERAQPPGILARRDGDPARRLRRLP